MAPNNYEYNETKTNRNGDITFLPKVLKEGGYKVAITGKVFHMPGAKYPAEWFDHVGDDKIDYDVCGGSIFCDCRGATCTDFPFKENVKKWIVEWKDSEESWAIFGGFVRPHTDLEFDWNLFEAPSQSGFNPASGNFARSKMKMSRVNEISKIDWAERPWLWNLNTTMRYYARSVYTVDSYIGEILQTLKDTGQDDSTLVVLFSDHGMTLGDGFDHFAKWTLMDESLHVPLVMRVPKVHTNDIVFKKKVIDDVVELVDVFPTIVEYAKIAMPQTERDLVDGESLFTQNRQKKFAISVLGYCETSIRSSKTRKLPCTTVKRGGLRVSAVGFSVRTNENRVTEWRKTSALPSSCNKMDMANCRVTPACVWLSTPFFSITPDVSGCVPNINPNSGGPSFTSRSSLVVAELYDNKGVDNLLGPSEVTGSETTSKIVEVLNQVFK